MKKNLLIIALFLSVAATAQSINNYKYVVIPRKFEFFKEENKYNLNLMTKMLFEKQGFTVYYADDNNKVEELALDRCKALYGNLINESGMLNTALRISLKDCNGNEIFLSEKGKSREKDFQKGYYEALRNASKSLLEQDYKYTGPAYKTAPANAQPLPSQPNPVLSQLQAAVPATVNVENQLFAQPIANGYQLVDNTPKIILKIYKTSQQDSFTAVSDTKNGVVFRKGNDWYFEYYQNDQLVSEKLNIRF